jgi:hypothetical protein
MMLGPLLWRYVASAEMGQASALAALMASIMLGGGLARKLIWARRGVIWVNGFWGAFLVSFRRVIAEGLCP